MGSTKVAAPPPRDVGKETRDNLQAQIDLADELAESEGKYRPFYADLERQIMLSQMGIDPSMGLLDAYEKAIVPAQGRMKAKATADEIAMIRDLGPELVEAQRSADPLADSIRREVMQKARDDLGSENPFDQLVADKEAERSGTNDYDMVVDRLKENFQADQGLTETEQRDLDQRILAQASDRGMEDQASTMADAISQRLSANRQIGRTRTSDLMTALTSRNRFNRSRDDDYARAIANQQNYKQQSLSNAGTAYQMGNFDVLKALTGRSGNAPIMAQQGFGSANFALDSSPAIFNPESQYGGQLASQNYQGQMDARVATASNRAGLMGGLLGFGGGLLGGMARGGTGFFRV